jgi:secondary thiamine-phosphate synthase enzyme
MPTETISVETDDRLTCLDITDRIASAVPEQADGTVTVFAQHTTCGVTVNEAEPRQLGDVEDFLSGLVADAGWAHDEIDDNADAHLRASLVGPSVAIPVVDGDLRLGTWQSVILVECDGPRRRSVAMTAA